MPDIFSLGVLDSTDEKTEDNYKLDDNTKTKKKKRNRFDKGKSTSTEKVPIKRRSRFDKGKSISTEKVPVKRKSRFDKNVNERQYDYDFQKEKTKINNRNLLPNDFSAPAFNQSGVDVGRNVDQNIDSHNIDYLNYKADNEVDKKKELAGKKNRARIITRNMLANNFNLYTIEEYLKEQGLPPSNLLINEQKDQLEDYYRILKREERQDGIFVSEEEQMKTIEKYGFDTNMYKEVVKEVDNENILAETFNYVLDELPLIRDGLDIATDVKDWLLNELDYDHIEGYARNVIDNIVHSTSGGLFLKGSTREQVDKAFTGAEEYFKSIGIPATYDPNSGDFFIFKNVVGDDGKTTQERINITDLKLSHEIRSLIKEIPAVLLLSKLGGGLGARLGLARLHNIGKIAGGAIGTVASGTAGGVAYNVARLAHTDILDKMTDKMLDLKAENYWQVIKRSALEDSILSSFFGFGRTTLPTIRLAGKKVKELLVNIGELAKNTFVGADKRNIGKLFNIFKEQTGWSDEKINNILELFYSIENEPKIIKETLKKVDGVSVNTQPTKERLVKKGLDDLTPQDNKEEARDILLREKVIEKGDSFEVKDHGLEITKGGERKSAINEIKKDNSIEINFVPQKISLNERSVKNLLADHIDKKYIDDVNVIDGKLHINKSIPIKEKAVVDILKKAEREEITAIKKRSSSFNLTRGIILFDKIIKLFGERPIRANIRAHSREIKDFKGLVKKGLKSQKNYRKEMAKEIDNKVNEITENIANEFKDLKTNRFKTSLGNQRLNLRDGVAKKIFSSVGVNPEHIHVIDGKLYVDKATKLTRNEVVNILAKAKREVFKFGIIGGGNSSKIIKHFGDDLPEKLREMM